MNIVQEGVGVHGNQVKYVSSVTTLAPLLLHFERYVLEYEVDKPSDLRFCPW